MSTDDDSKSSPPPKVSLGRRIATDSYNLAADLRKAMAGRSFEAASTTLQI